MRSNKSMMPVMKADDFAAWRKHMKFNGTEAANQLGISRNTVRWYEEGRHQPPRSIALACTAIALGLRPWPVTEGGKDE